MRHALPLDLVSCCNADIRRIQARMHLKVKRASPLMLSCLADLLDSELSKWKATWRVHVLAEAQLSSDDDPSFDLRLLHPGRGHLSALVELWDQSVRLNVSSAILRRVLMASMTSSLQADEQPVQTPPLRLDLPAITDLLSIDVVGLSSSVEGAFGTIRQLLCFPAQDLRRAPDAVLLLGPNAALYLCLLLCLPSQGIIGPSFQARAVTLIRSIARHVRRAVQSPHDTTVLHAAYLESLVELLEPDPSHAIPQSTRRSAVLSALEASDSNNDENLMPLDETTLQAAQDLAEGTDNFGGNAIEGNNAGFNILTDTYQDLDIQSLANLLDPELFLGMPLLDIDGNVEL